MQERARTGYRILSLSLEHGWICGQVLADLCPKAQLRARWFLVPAAPPAQVRPDVPGLDASAIDPLRADGVSACHPRGAPRAARPLPGEPNADGLSQILRLSAVETTRLEEAEIVY